jgi:hypothetical protein
VSLLNVRGEHLIRALDVNLHAADGSFVSDL